MEAAQRSADRMLRRSGWRGDLPRRVACVWSEQKRGLWHVHEALPAGSEVERAWTRQVVRFIDAARKRDEMRCANEVATLVDVEHYLGEPTRGFYGFGFVDRNPLRKLGVSQHGGSPVRAAAYLARNAARYLGENVESAREGQELPGRALRSYVSRRLTLRTGCTVRNLRRARYVYVCIRDSLPLPEWSPEELEAVARLLGLGVVEARAP